MKKLYFTILILIFGTQMAFARSIPSQSLTKGESVTINVDYEIGDVAMTDRSVVDYLVQENRQSIYLNAKKEGFATLTLWNSKNEVQDSISISVYGVTLSNIIKEAKQAFRSITTIQYLVQDNTLRIVGEALSPSEFKRIQEFADRYAQVFSDVAMARAVLNTLTNRIEHAIATPGIKVRAVRNRIILEGVAYSSAAVKKAEEIAKLYAPDALNLIEIKKGNRSLGKEKMVQLDLYFMEIQKSALKTFGIQWAPGSFPKSESSNMSIGGGGGNGGVGGLAKSLIGFVLNLAPKIRFMKESGLGRVLENPTLFVKSGDSAQFFSGVQVPYYSQETVQFKEVGVKLLAEPIISGKDIDLKLSATISSPSPHIQGGINTHTIATTAYVPLGQAAVLGGILTNRDVKTYNRIPKNISTSTALFTLFLSKDFQSSNSELVVFVLPRVVDRVANAKAEQKKWKEMEEKIIKERSMKEYKKYLSKVDKLRKKKFKWPRRDRGIK